MGTVVSLVPQELDVGSPPNVSLGRDGVVEMASLVVTSLTTPDRGVAGSSPAVEAGGVASPEVSLPAGTAVSPASAASEAGRHHRARRRRLKWFAKRDAPSS